MPLSNEIVFEYDVPVRMRDGAVIRANVYRPVAQGTYPVLANMGPYSKDVSFRQLYGTMWRSMIKELPEIVAGGDEDQIKWEVPDPQRWVPRGYVVVHADARGSGRSPGRWDPLSPTEQQDGADLIEWCGTQPWSSGKVGISGVSYYAAFAWLTAAQQPAHLKAMIPFNGWVDPYRDFLRHGGIVSQFPEHWWNRWLINQHGQPKGRIGVISGERVTGPETLSESEREEQREDFPRNLVERETFDQWYRDRTTDLSKVTIPFLSITTWGTMGLHLRGNIEAFTQAASKEKWLVAMAGELGRTEDFHRDAGIETQQHFLDHYLKDAGTWSPPSRVVVHAMTAGHHGPKVLKANTWPLEGTAFTKLYADFERLTLADTQPRQQGEHSYQAFSQGVTLLSTPAAKETTIAGPIKARLWVSTCSQDMDIFSELRVVGSDGILINYVNPTQVVTSGTTPGTPVTRGWLRLSHRAIDPAKSVEERPYHSHRELAEVRCGEVYEVEIEYLPTAFVVPAGASLSLTFHGEDDPQTELVRHHHPEDRTWKRFRGLNICHSGPGRASYILLPVIPD